ncbi:fibrous sheath CABYR-binding protein-like [Pristis pectinata]|uniref:fibrous sheath CABYR-binding protein-like n=1 Tax=Pristis pectinata TaxID=685728 RepID=UPI00223D294B|nr:fibrous sheath CABYR-binding protein-like [Pristis pectinata]
MVSNKKDLLLKMFTWIAKVAPQPPQPVRHLETRPEAKDVSPPAEEQKTVEAEKPKNEAGDCSNAGGRQDEADQTAVSTAVTSSGGGVLVWIAQNMSRLVPLHIDSPRLPKGAQDSEKNAECQEFFSRLIFVDRVHTTSTSSDSSSCSDSDSDSSSGSNSSSGSSSRESSRSGFSECSSSRDPIIKDKGRGGGVLTWFVRGLKEVLPQPEKKPKPTDAAEVTAALQVTKEEPANPQKEEPPIETKPEPEIKPQQEPEVKGEDVVTETSKEPTDHQAEPQANPTPTGPTVETLRSSASSSSLFEWLKQSLEKVVPQPVGISAPATAKVETEAAPENKVPVEEKEPEVKVTEIQEEVPKAVTIIEVAPAEPTPDPIVKEEKQPTSEAIAKTSVFSWLVQGLGKVVPQPVTKSQLPKEDVGTTPACSAEEVPNEMVLEDVDSDWDEEAQYHDAETQTSECEVLEQLARQPVRIEVTPVAVSVAIVIPIISRAEARLWFAVSSSGTDLCLEDSEIMAHI